MFVHVPVYVLKHVLVRHVPEHVLGHMLENVPLSTCPGMCSSMCSGTCMTSGTTTHPPNVGQVLDNVVQVLDIRWTDIGHGLDYCWT